jgi:hypothetical protein
LKERSKMEVDRDMGAGRGATARDGTPAIGAEDQYGRKE